MSDNSRLVYSTDHTVKKNNKRPKERHSADLPAALQKVTVMHERKGRGGKSVTVIAGLQLDNKKRETLLKSLKSGLGTGGAVKGSTLEIQGDHCDEVMSVLRKNGYSPKRSGG